MENEGDKSAEKVVWESVWLRGKMREILIRHKSFLLEWAEPIIWGDFGVSQIILGLQLILHSFS